MTIMRTWTAIEIQHQIRSDQGFGVIVIGLISIYVHLVGSFDTLGQSRRAKHLENHKYFP